MKRLAALCIAGAAAVLAVSCGKEGAVREDGASKVEFTASELQVKTVFGEKADGEYPVLWTADEKVALFYNSQTGDQTEGGQNVAVTPLENGHTANFSASIMDDESGNHYFYAFSPRSALNGLANEDWDGDGVKEKYVYAQIPCDQIPKEGTCDEKAQIIYSMKNFTEFPDKVNLTFCHLTAYGLIKSLELPEDTGGITEILIESNKFLSGEIYCNANTPEEVMHNAKTGLRYIDLNIEKSGLKANKLENVFFACTPQTDGNDVFGEGDNLKFTVYTDTDTWVKTVNFSADRTLAFKAGRISSFSVSAHGFEKQ